MYTGAINKEDTSKIRFMNNKNYFNKWVGVFDGKNVQNLQVSPTVDFKYIKDTYNGMQFAPNCNDTIKYFDAKFMDVFSLQEDNSNDDVKYGSTENKTNPQVDVKMFKPDPQTPHPTETNTAFLLNQPVSFDIGDHKMYVNSQTGILIAQNYTRQNKLTFPSAKNNQTGTVKDIILPFPGLDMHAGQSLILTKEVEDLQIDQSKFNEIFKFVGDTKDTVHVTSILFLSLMIIVALVFVGMLVFYNVSLKNLPDVDEEDGDAAFNSILKKGY